MVKTVNVQTGKSNPWSFAVSVGNVHSLSLFPVSVHDILYTT